jgi:hypothetical protein
MAHFLRYIFESLLQAMEQTANGCKTIRLPRDYYENENERINKSINLARLLLIYGDGKC